VAVFGALATISAFVAPYAVATNIGDLQAQARDLEAHINELGNQESQLSEQYDAGVIQLQKAETDVARAQAQVDAANARADQTRTVLQADAVDAYVNNGQGSLSGSGPASTVSGADANLLREEYSQSLATSQSDVEDRYRLDSKLSSRAESNLKTQESVAAANLVAITADEKRVQSAQVTLVAVEAQVKGRIATLIAQQLAAERRAAQLAAERRLAAQRAAAAAAAREAAQERAAAAANAAAQQALATTSTTSPTLAPPPTTVVAPSGAAAEAVAAAESRVGDPYVWGAVGPTTFDCSGLVMWAYAQAGVVLPHYSGSQYAVTEHIPMSDLEPGDLVFFANPGEHVAMYVGDGDVVQAPYTGADVQIVPLFPEFVLASRVV
jgi:cell wall-associated NlpC family hydrolase